MWVATIREIKRFSRRRLEPLLCAGLMAVAILMMPGGAGAQENQDAKWRGTPQEKFFNSRIMQKFQCKTCHTVMESGGTVGPILNNVGLRRDEKWLRKWIKNPQAIKPGTKMPAFEFTPEEYEEVIGYLAAMKRPLHTGEILSKNLSPIEQGQALFEDFECYACHRIGDKGRFTGPDLTWLGLRKSREWERTWLHDPQAWKPGTFMPNFHLPAPAIEALTAFLENLRGQKNEASQNWEFNVNFFLNSEPDEIGEFVYKRFACWSCHGDDGTGGQKNPNAAPNGLTPSIVNATVDHDADELLVLLSQRRLPKKLHASQPAPPFACPEYGKFMSEGEFEALYAFLETLAPASSEWEVE